ncbi:hypothetical protein Ocin01_03723, partial [Orchesella cincta]
MTTEDRKISRALEVITAVGFWLLLLVEIFSWINFIFQPNSISYIFSTFPESWQKFCIFRFTFYAFEFWSKVLFSSCNGFWISLFHILPSLILILWARNLMNGSYTISGHIQNYKLLQTLFTQLNAIIGRLYLSILVGVLGCTSIVLFYSIIKFHGGKVHNTTYLFYACTALVTLAFIQTLLYVNGSVYEMSGKYLHKIRKQTPNGNTFLEKLVRKQVKDQEYFLSASEPALASSGLGSTGVRNPRNVGFTGIFTMTAASGSPFWRGRLAILAVFRKDTQVFNNACPNVDKLRTYLG